MSYAEMNLMPDERIVCTARIHWVVFIPGALIMAWALRHAIAGGVDRNPAFFVFFWLGMFFLTRAYAKRAATELAVTTRRVFVQRGVIKRETIEIHHSKVESFVVVQGILGRLFGYGTVTVNGTGGVRAPIAKVEKPLDFRRNAVAAVDAAQSQGTLRSQAA